MQSFNLYILQFQVCEFFMSTGLVLTSYTVIGVHGTEIYMFEMTQVPNYV